MERALFAVGVVFVALEKTSGEWVAVVAQEKEFHPGIADDVVVILEHDVAIGNVCGQIPGGGKSLEDRERFAFGEEGLAVIIGTATSNKDKR